MQAVVKAPHIRIEARKIPARLLSFLRSEYKHVEVISNPEDELIEAQEALFYKKVMRDRKPGDDMRIYRELHGLTQEQLGKKLGRFTRQHISDMENGARPISKTVARNLAKLFDVSVSRFI